MIKHQIRRVHHFHDYATPSIDEMTTDEFGLRSMSDIDPVDLRMSSRQWELQGLVPSGKALDHVSMYGMIFRMRKMQRMCIRCS
jgi:hypothetical protein